MKISNYLILILLVLITTTGCVPHSLYEWNGYDQTLYNHYRNPAGYDQFVQDLKDTVALCETEGKIPPGIYAEYGYVLYEQGNFPEAINYFTKERNKWPESRIIMTKMIDNANKKSAQEVKQKNPVTNDTNQVKEVAK